MKRGGSAAELSAFEAEMASSASLISERRSAAIQEDGFDAETNLRLAEGDEGLNFCFGAVVPDLDEELFGCFGKRGVSGTAFSVRRAKDLTAMILNCV